MRNISVLFVVVFVFSSQVLAQDSPAKTAMSQLSFLMGERSGEGWHSHGASGTNEFFQESFGRFQMDGEVMFTEQKALLAPDYEVILHQSVSFYSFVEETGEIIVRTLLNHGGLRESTVEVKDEGFTWIGGGNRWEIMPWNEDGWIQRAFNLDSGDQVFELVMEPVSGK